MHDDEPVTSCHCAALPDLAVVPMGGDGLDGRVFATIDTVRDHGGAQWWLYLARCSACGQDWTVAQEARIYDDYFLKRLSADEAAAICDGQSWPEDFLTYARVLRIGAARSNPCIYLDPRSSALADTITDLRREEPDNPDAEIGRLIGVSERRVATFGGSSVWPRWWRRRFRLLG